MDRHRFLELRGVSKIYENTSGAGVRDIDLQIEKGTLNIIAGESGSGKSTLLKLIGGQLAPDSGTVVINEERVKGPHERLIPGHDALKMVAQSFELNTYAKVFDNIATQLPNTNLAAKKQKSFEVMEFLRIDHLAQKRVVDLSGGEQQRVAIARAIVTEPEVLLMDEPFSQIDAMIKNDLRSDVRRMVKFLGITVVLVSHDPMDGLSLADKMFIIKGGRIVESGAPRDLYENPQSLYTASLLASCNALSSGDAQAIGIDSSKEIVAVYPEWVRLVKGEGTFAVKDVYFKGFYEELVLEKNGVQFRALHSDSVNYEKGQMVDVEITRYLEFPAGA
ncbi:ABC transporter ATP-binding protein [Arcticibacter sp. MXS-1]|uniref:ABC transporter ATP-binding protein n=1 Tax=Arcticibacter sp. MXS-1 TaxID=3341726 RepID=UPI0035A8DB6A